MAGQEGGEDNRISDMSDDDLRYDVMVEDALRGVVRRALKVAASRGLPGDHHFYITFLTTHPGVKIPAHLHERYPNEMTIVLQFQFWGLEIEEESFRVTLSFNDKPERLHIPFAAIKAFADPSVRFGLQFDGVGDEDEEEETVEGESVTDLSFAAEEEAREKAILEKATRKKQTAEESEGEDEAPAEESGDKVVTLDAFRKK